LPTTSQPTPSNAHIDQAVNEALADINRYCNLAETSTDISISVAAQTANGAYRHSLGLLAATYPHISIQQVRVAYWNDGTAVERLTPTSRSEMDRDESSWQNTDNATPDKYWIEAGQICLYPSPLSAGTLVISCTTGLSLDEADGSVPTEIPADYHPVICDMAAALVASATPEDTEMASRYSMLAERVVAGREDILRWYANRSPLHKPTVQVFSYR
jgi:hypothetical protein